jgi:hypothetical protein
MKKLNLSAALFIFSIAAFSQIHLGVHLLLSQSKGDITFIVDTLKVYNGPSLYKKKAYPDSFALFEEVPSGTYTFQYKNLFGEKVEQVIEVNESNSTLGVQELNLFVDQLKTPKSNTSSIDNLKDGEVMTIRFKYSGCFSSGADSLEIFRKKENLFLKYGQKKRKLKQKDLDALKKYELELRSLPDVGFVSTSNGTNEIILPFEKFSYVEPSVYWGGFEILKSRLRL